MNTMCCKVFYLYIELLAQSSYLTYVGFLNIDVVKTLRIQHLNWLRWDRTWQLKQIEVVFGDEKVFVF